MSSDALKSDSATTVDLRDVAQLFRNNFWKIACSVLGAMALALFYLSHARPVYKSSALIEVAEGSRKNPNPTEIDTSDTLKTIELKIASQSVLLGVIRAHHLADDPDFTAPEASGLAQLNLGPTLAAGCASLLRLVKAEQLAAAVQPAPTPPAATPGLSDAELARRFAAKLSVSLVRGSRLISLTVMDHDPQKARRLVQAVIDEFFRQARDAQTQDSAHARELLLAEAKRVGEDYKASQEKLEAYRNKYNAVSLQERQNIVVERLRDLNQQVAAAKNLRLGRESEQEQVTRLLKSAPDQLLGMHSIADAPEIVDLRKQITLQEAQLATLSQRYGPLHPTLIQAKSQLEELRSALQSGLRKAVDRVRESYESAKATEAALETSLAEQEKTALELDRVAIPYHSLERDMQANGSMYQKVLDNLKQFDVEHGLITNSDVNGIDIRVVEPPLAAIKPTSPRQRLLLALSAAAGLFLGCGLALITRALDNSVSSVDQAETTFGRPVLCTVPRTRHHRLKGNPVVIRYPSSIQAEAFRSLRTAISLLGSDEERRCVLFTSAVPGEGKSFCSLNCAASFAQEGRRTLLIDGDLRRPSLQWLFAHPNEKPTLTACLRDPERFAEATQRTPIENLFRLGDWQHEAGSAELLGRDGMREIIRRALEGFDRVVIDTAPLMAVSDTLHIAKNVPTICMVVYAGRTPRRLTRRAMQLLQEVAKRPATGLVLNKVSARSVGDQYYYYNA